MKDRQVNVKTQHNANLFIGNDERQKKTLGLLSDSSRFRSFNIIIKIVNIIIGGEFVFDLVIKYPNLK